MEESRVLRINGKEYILSATKEKYILLHDDTITVNGRTLSRVQKVGDPMEIIIGAEGEKMVIEPGTKGGYIERTENLSQYCRSWVGDGSIVYGSATIQRDAVVLNSKVSSEPIVIEEMKFGDMVVHKKTIIAVTISGSVVVKDSTIEGPCWIAALDSVIENAKIIGSDSRKHPELPHFDPESGSVIKNYSNNWGGIPISFQGLRRLLCDKSYGVQIHGERIQIKRATIKDGVRIRGHNISVSRCVLAEDLAIEGEDYISVTNRGIYPARRRLDQS